MCRECAARTAAHFLFVCQERPASSLLMQKSQAPEDLSVAINKVEHWQYKSEGELNLVLGYRGDSTALRGKVLRHA